MEIEIKKSINNLKNIIRKQENDYYGESVKILSDVMPLVKNDSKLKEYVKKELIKISCDNYKLMIFIFSCILNIDFDKEQHVRYLQYQLDNVGRVEIETSVYVMSQIEGFEFRHPCVVSVESRAIYCELKDRILDQYRVIFEDIISWIPTNERRKDLVFVMCDQYIGEFHGPTKETNKIAKAIIKGLNKNVVLINTAEMLGFRNAFYIYDCLKANYLEEYTEKTEIIFENISIPFFQCEDCMPDIDIMRVLLNFIKAQKPEYIVSVGSGVISINLAAEIVPVIVFPLAYDVGYIKAQCYVVSQNWKPGEIDSLVLERMKKHGQILLEQRPSYHMYTPKESHNRNDFDIPDDIFLAVVVSGRVEYDLSDDFFEMLSDDCLNDVGLLIIGNANGDYINKVVSRYPKLNGRLFTTGIVEGVLEYYNMCDLYLNPKRNGGGTSAAEAMYSGLPILSIDYGDIGHLVDTDSLARDYNAMKNILLKYLNDDLFYKKMAAKALGIGKAFANADALVSEVLEEFEVFAENH